MCPGFCQLARVMNNALLLQNNGCNLPLSIKVNLFIFIILQKSDRMKCNRNYQGKYYFMKYFPSICVNMHIATYWIYMSNELCIIMYNSLDINIYV